MNDFSEKIINTIDERQARPKPRWHFLLKRSVFWSLAALSVIIGGIAVSVAIYVFIDNDGLFLTTDKTLHEALLDIAKSIPYVWLSILSLFSVSAYLVFRKTKKGYRYRTAQVVGAVITASILLGIGFAAFDFGKIVHVYLYSNTAFYDMLIHSSEDDAA